MKSPLFQTLLLIVLLVVLLPSQAFGQEAVRLFDLEVDEHFYLSDPGQLTPDVPWLLGGMSLGLFDQTAAFAGLARAQLLAGARDQMSFVDGVDGARTRVYSLPDLDLRRGAGSDLLPLLLSVPSIPQPATADQTLWYQLVKNGETGEWELLVLVISF
jgi:hypothetical protein